jgi:hypothetical protein
VPTVIAIVVIVVTVLFIGSAIGGFFAARAGNPLTLAPPSGRTAEGCADACRQWDNARQMQCNAAADEAAATKRADAIRGAFYALLALAAVLIGAAISATIGIGTIVAASTNPITFAGYALAAWLTAVAVGLYIAAVATLLAATFLAGQLIAADADAGLKSSRRQAWDAEVARTRLAVNSSCSAAEAALCLSRTGPC